MIAILYRFYLLPDQEETYQEQWLKVASYFKQYRGALGSCLHQAEDGLWVAYSRWPDRETWKASWPREEDPSTHLPKEIQEAIIQMKACADDERKLPEIVMDIKEDLEFKGQA